jgi:hypothetical protein
VKKVSEQQKNAQKNKQSQKQAKHEKAKHNLPNTRGQHYVWRHYLEASEVDGKLHCLRDGAVFPTSARQVGKQRDFYRLHDLTREDIQWIEHLALPQHPPQAVEAGRNFINMFTLPFRLKKAIDPKSPRAAELLQEADRLINNIEEGYHGGIEGDSIGLLKRLRSGDASIVDDAELMLRFTYYIALQFLRTKRVQERVIRNLTSNLTDLPFDPRRCWNVLRHLFAMRFGGNLYVERAKYRLIFLENATEMPFIAGDQPLINTYDLTGAGMNNHELEFYYPLSPTRAMLWTDRHNDDGFPTPKHVTDNEVQHYNKLMKDMSLEMVFANSQAALQC